MDFTKHPLYPKIANILSYFLLTFNSCVSLYYYFGDVAENDFWHWQILGYLIMIANGLGGFTQFLDEESFFPLRDLLDYSQLVLVLPCYAAQMWVHTETGPEEIAIIHAGLGIVAFVMFLVYECRRQDLTDLAIFANALSLLGMVAIEMNVPTLFSTALIVGGYYMYKRHDDDTCTGPVDNFNFVMAAFATMSLVSFDENIMESIQDITGFLGSGGSASGSVASGSASY